jgi:hypothetical protein
MPESGTGNSRADIFNHLRHTVINHSDDSKEFEDIFFKKKKKIRTFA